MKKLFIISLLISSPLVGFARRHYYGSYRGESRGEEILAALIILGILFFIMWIADKISQAGGIKNATKKLGYHLEQAARKGERFTEQATQQVANKVAKVVHNAKVAAVSEQEKTQKEKEKLEMEQLKQRINDLENLLNKRNLLNRREK